MNRKKSLSFCITLLFCCMLQGQQSDSPSGNVRLFGIFTDETPIEMTLKFDLSTYFRKKPADEYLKCEMIFHTSENDSLVRTIRLRTRGEFRHRECTFPPIELNWKKANLGYADLDSISKIKLVTQCAYSGGDGDNVLEEYLVYKLFNVLTDTSFRVRLVRITYVDTGKEIKSEDKDAAKQEKQRSRKPIQQWAFLIEPNDILAKRINAIQIKTTTITQKNIEPFVMDRLAMFNYMIGNYDWSIPGQHNVKVFKSAIPGINPYVIAIPYDFDWSGIVNALYAIPVEETGVNSVRERLFLGICRPKETFMKQLDLLASKKDEFYSIINNFEYLKKKERDDLTGFLDTFYEQLSGNRSRLLEYLNAKCKKF